MLLGLFNRVLWNYRPNAAFRRARSTALRSWRAKYEAGALETASPLERNMRRVIDAEIDRLTNGGTKEAHARVLEELYIHSWAAHCLPEDIYNAFYLKTMFEQEAYGLLAAQEAKNAVAGLRRFPALDAILR